MILSKRGEVLHNHFRNQILEDGDLLLVDSGVLLARWVCLGHHAHPAGERRFFFTAARHLRDRSARPGRGHRVHGAGRALSWRCHLAAARVVVEGLGALGLMRGDPAVAVAAGAHALFFPHGLGHMPGS